MVDRTANLELAAKEIIAAKSFGASQSPYAPNSILVNEFVEAEFTRLLLKHLPGIASSPNGGITQSKAAKMAKASNVVLTTSSYKIIKVAQRQVLHPLWERMSDRYRTEINTSTEKDSHSLPMLAVSSYDDAIDALATKEEKQLLAFYVFADPLPAKYLT
ncbi:hypothetical protein MMC13_001394 [Lambiella insularis]|nr:hypothetical protein [Lambiella insularis]